MAAQVRKSDGDEVLIEALLGGDPSQAIENQEKRGQDSLVLSDSLPCKVQPERGPTPYQEPYVREENDKPFLDLGFTFGEPYPSDPMFRDATLPPGWRKASGDHAMWVVHS